MDHAKEHSARQSRKAMLQKDISGEYVRWTGREGRHLYRE